MILITIICGTFKIVFTYIYFRSNNMRIPNEVLAEVLAFMDRDQLERLQMVSRRFRDLIRRQFPKFPRRRNPVAHFLIVFYPPDRYLLVFTDHWTVENVIVYGPMRKFDAAILRGELSHLISLNFQSVTSCVFPPYLSR